MCTRRLRTALVLLVPAVLMLPAPATSAAPGVTMAGVTTITGTRPGYVDVRVPRTVTVDTSFDGGRDLAVSGAGALTAFVLVGTDARTRGFTLAGGAAVVSGQAERFLMPVPEWPALGGGTYEDTKTYANSTKLPGGSYRLYYVSTSRGTVTLRLPGLSGRTTIRPGGRVTAKVAPPDHELTGTPVRENVFVASTTEKLTRRGFALQVLHSRLEAEAAWQLVMCHNNPAQSAAEPLREAPGCPAGEKHTFVNHRYPGIDPDTKMFVQAYAGLPAGEHGLSAIFTNEGRATAIGYSTLWLEY